MATPLLITTAETAVSGTGAIAGALDVSALTKIGSVHLRVRNLVGTMRIVLEDTANATPFADALAAWVVDSAQGQQPDGNTYSVRITDLPTLRFGATHNELRFNVNAISAGATASVLGWLDQ